MRVLKGENSMKNRFLVLFGIVFVLLGFISLKAYSEPHWNNQTTFMSQDDGDSMRMFSIQVGTVTAARVYYSTQTAAPQRSAYASPDRILTIENPTSFNLFCGTYPTVNATSGARFEIFNATTPTLNVFQTYAAPSNIYCIFEAAANGSKEVLGWVGYDSGD